MDINRNNYEHFLLDYLEGRLSPDQREIVDRFLKFNPDLADEFASLYIQKVKPEEIEFSQKENLKKYIPVREDVFSPDNFEMFAIAFLEGDLTKMQKKAFKNHLLKHPELNQQLNRLRNTHIEPPQIEYPNKNKLRKSDQKTFFLRYMVPVAAAAAILFIVFINLPKTANFEEVASVEIPDENPNNDIENETENNEEGSTIIRQRATINVIKNNKALVPASSFKKEKEVIKKNENKKPVQSTADKNKKRRIASLQASSNITSQLPVKYDRIQLNPIDPPDVNLSSVSVQDVARNQINRVTNALQNEDELLVSLVSNGLKELNKRAGTEAEILASRNEEGDIRGVYFKSRFLQFRTPLRADD